MILDSLDQELVRVAFTGTAEPKELVLSQLLQADPNELQTCTVESMKWNISGTGIVRIELTPNIAVAELTGEGEIDGGKFSDAGGNVSFITEGMSQGEAYELEVTLKKQDGFLQDNEQ